MLPNWTWLHSPATRTPVHGERKCSGVCRCEARTGSSSSRLKLLNTFRGRFLKATPGMKVAAYGLSSDGLVVWSEGKVLGILILNPGGEGDARGWDGWMASPTRWTSVWVSSQSWWWTRKPGMLQSMGSQRVGRDWATALNWILNPLVPASLGSKACGQHTVTIHLCRDLSVCRTAQIYASGCYIHPWGGTKAPVLLLNYCFLTAFPLFLHSLTFLIINCLSLYFGTQERPRRLKSFFSPYNQETWGTSLVVR